MTPLETRFDTKLPTLVTKVDLKQVEIRLAISFAAGSAAAVH